MNPRPLAMAAVSAAALVGALAIAPAAAAPAPSVFDHGWTVLAFGDASLGNAETEGSIAVGGDLRFTKGYPVVHSTGLTPTDYDLPRVDGTPVRLLIGGQFDAQGSAGVSQVTSAHNVTADQIGQVRIGDTTNLAINPRGQVGLWMSPAGTGSGTEPALEVTDRVNQSAASVLAPGAFDDLLGTAQAEAVSTATQLASCTAHEVTLAPGSHGGARTLTLAVGTNVLNVRAADLGDFSIELQGAPLGPGTSLVVNVTDPAGTVTLPGFSAAANTSAAQPNTVAPWVVWNFGTAEQVSLTGSKVSGSVLAPLADLSLNANSPIEGQIVGEDITSTGGEFHHYGLKASFDCGDTTPGTPSGSATPEVSPSVEPSTEPSTEPSVTPSASVEPSDSTSPSASETTSGSVAGETESNPTDGDLAGNDESAAVAGASESNDTAADRTDGNGILPDTGASALALLLGLLALGLVAVGGSVLAANRQAPRH